MDHRTTAMTPESDSQASHLRLMQRARLLSSSALDHDVDAFHDQLTELRTVLSAHIEEERGMLDGLSPAVGRVVARGQQSLVALVDDVLRDHEADEGRCACLRRANELAALLARQARLEGDVLADRSPIR